MVLFDLKKNENSYKSKSLKIMCEKVLGYHLISRKRTGSFFENISSGKNKNKNKKNKETNLIQP